MDPENVDDVGRVPHGGSDAVAYDFSANTNPRTPPGAREVYEASFDQARRYPDDAYPEYRAAAASFVDCDPNQVVPTPGGLAAIRLAFATHVGSGDRVLLPTPSFAEYAREARLQGGVPRFRPHDELLEADPTTDAMTVVCNPNNPTGEAADPARLRAFASRCREAGTVLLVDEAFLGYTEQPSIAGTPGTIVARSLTKLFGLPGIRAGYAVATGDALDRLGTARRPWNLSAPAARTGAYCLAQTDFVRETRERIASERARLRGTLETAYDVYQSDAPFLLLEVGDRDVETVRARARDAGVAIRDATTFRGLDNHVRVAIKDPVANDRLLEAMDVRDPA